MLRNRWCIKKWYLFLKSLGLLNLEGHFDYSSSVKMFDAFKVGEERQGARYIWLMFAFLLNRDIIVEQVS